MTSACQHKNTFVTPYSDTDGVGDRICSDCGTILGPVQVHPFEQQWGVSREHPDDPPQGQGGQGGVRP